MQYLPPLDPDGVTVGQLSPRQGLRRVDAGSPLPGQGGNSGSSPSQESSSSQGSVSNASGVPGIVGGAVSMGLGLSPLGQVPGVTAGVNAAMQGSSLDAIQDAVLGDLLGWGGASLASNLGLGYGIPGIVGAVTSEAVKDNPNYGATALGSTAQVGSAMLGGVLGGPFGSIIGGTLGRSLANSSLKEGYLGDLADSRSREKDRDAVESAFGVSVADTESMARVDSIESFLDGLEAMAGAASGVTGKSGRSSAMDANLGFDFGLDSAVASTTSGKLSSAADDAFGFSTVEGFIDAAEEAATNAQYGLDVMGSDISSDATMGGYSYGDPADLSGDGSSSGSSGTDGGYGDPDAGGEGMI